MTDHSTYFRPSSRPVTLSLSRALIATSLWLGLALPAQAAEGDPTAAPADGALQKAVDSLQGDVKKLKGLKVSGFIQARLELNDSSKDGISSDGKTVANKDIFSIRRGRLKTTYTGIPGAEVMMQIDATGKGLSLIDAEVSLLSPIKQVEGKLTLGQTKVPFGYEIAQSSNERELPERSLVINRFFPGVRDRGLKLSTSFSVARLSLAILNGNGIDDSGTILQYQEDKDGDGVISEAEAAVKTGSTLNFANADRDKVKDFAGRLGVDVGFLQAGVSGYSGQWGVVPVLIATRDAESGVLSYSGGDALNYLQKTRLGADVQLGLELVKPLGKSILRGEFVKGHGLFYNDKQLDVDAQGWYVTLVQNLTDKAAFAIRADQFDADLSSDKNETFTIEPEVILYPSSNAKVSLSYQVIQDFDAKDDAGEKTDKKNNQLTLQFQGKF